MNARSKLTLLITAVGSFAVLFFSAITLWEMLDDQLSLIDDQLNDLSKWALTVSEPLEAQTSEIQTSLKYLPYWITISEAASGEVLYRSNQAQHFELPHLPPHKGTIRHMPVPDNLGINRDNEGCADFRARCMVSHSGKIRICVARSLDNMQKEFWKCVHGIAIGFATFVVVLLGTSYIAAGLILRPLAVFNQQARTISETLLQYRLPLTKANDEFNELAVTLNKVFARLEYAFQQRKQFIANAAHELRTPLAIMRLSLYNAATDIKPCARPKLSELLEQVLRMERLVKMLLDLSILEEEREGKEYFKDFDATKYTKSLFGMFGGEEARVTLEGEAYLVGVLIDRFGKDIAIVPKDESHFTAHVNVAVSPHFLGWIFSLGNGIRITAPESLVNQMREEAKRLTEQYS